jgi:ABC-type bacteriocin/lantibiotic exporter with double-glycine peptidase domain
MGRSKVSPIIQPDDVTCGPAAQKLSLEILGIKRSLKHLISLCRPTRNGTSMKRMINSYRKLGIPVLYIERATLRHLQSALKYAPNKVRAVLVSFLYDDDDDGSQPHPDSGHWAVVSAFSASKSRIYVLDSYTGQKKSYDWQDFRDRWRDFDFRRKKMPNHGKRYTLVRKWQKQPMLVIARNAESLPKFGVTSAKIILPD